MFKETAFFRFVRGYLCFFNALLFLLHRDVNISLSGIFANWGIMFLYDDVSFRESPRGHFMDWDVKSDVEDAFCLEDL